MFLFDAYGDTVHGQFVYGVKNHIFLPSDRVFRQTLFVRENSATVCHPYDERLCKLVGVYFIEKVPRCNAALDLLLVPTVRSLQCAYVVWPAEGQQGDYFLSVIFQLRVISALQIQDCGQLGKIQLIGYIGIGNGVYQGKKIPLCHFFHAVLLVGMFCFIKPIFQLGIKYVARHFP